MGFFDLLFGGSAGRSNVVSLPTARKIKDDWEKVQELLKLGGPSQLRQALITADKLLDNALKEVAAGESMGERLKNARDIFDRYQYQTIWEAHKLRNNLVHEVGFEPQHFVIKEAGAPLATMPSSTKIKRPNPAGRRGVIKSRKP